MTSKNFPLTRISRREAPVADTIESERDWRAYFNSLGERVGPQDLFRQVGRTIGGEPMNDQQILFLVEDTCAALDLNAGDCLLDLCCGNGQVTVQLAAVCSSTVAVDASEFLIDVARRYRPPAVQYVNCSVTELTIAQLGGWRPSKICMLAALQHFTVTSLTQLIRALGAITGHGVPLYFADVPDVDHLFDFYNTRERRADYERRKAAGTEAIGTWWSTGHLAELFASHGYSAEVRNQDRRRSGTHYRFDLLARPTRSS
jgi:cyclopropane fatty-acyl-phospholipid synthase-like methyltransferase